MMRDLINIHDFHGTQLILPSICMSLHAVLWPKGHIQMLQSHQTFWKQQLFSGIEEIRLSNKAKHFPQMIPGTNPNAGKPDPDHIWACLLSNPQVSTTEPATPTWLPHSAASLPAASLWEPDCKGLANDRSIYSIYITLRSAGTRPGTKTPCCATIPSCQGEWQLANKWQMLFYFTILTLFGCLIILLIIFN